MKYLKTFLLFAVVSANANATLLFCADKDLKNDHGSYVASFTDHESCMEVLASAKTATLVCVGSDMKNDQGAFVATFTENAECLSALQSAR
jgi:hypothetical protein